MNELLNELRHLIVDTLNLADVDATTIDLDAPLFGSGLGLDSIDALELAVAISKKYSVNLKADEVETTQAFASVRSLATHIQART
jgi:acyl carrier protein